MNKDIIVKILGGLTIAGGLVGLSAYYERKGFDKCINFIKQHDWTIIDENGNDIYIHRKKGLRGL